MDVTIFYDQSKIVVSTTEKQIQVHGLVGNPFTTADGKLVDLLVHNHHQITVSTSNGKVSGSLVGTSPLTVKTDDGIVTFKKYHMVLYEGSNDTKTIAVVNRDHLDEQYTFTYMTDLLTWSPIFHHTFLSDKEISTKLLACISSKLNEPFTGATLVTNGDQPDRSYRYKEESCLESCRLESASFSVNNNVTSNATCMLKYTTNDTIYPGTNICAVDSEVCNSISSVFIIDLERGRKLSHQFIKYELTQNYPAGKHVFYDTQGTLIVEGFDSEYRKGAIYKRSIGTTAEFTAETSLTYVDRKPSPDVITIKTTLTRSRPCTLFLRRDLSNFKVSTVTIVPQVPHYFEDKYLYIDTCDATSIDITIEGEAGKRYSL